MPVDDKPQGTQTAKPMEGTAINLPKGGGAIRGIGEKFQANPVTGSGSFSVPLPVSPGRGGFQPDMSLGYDSGGGNSVFGLGWSIGSPSIRRKTDRILPQYLDKSESDIFLLAGAEDLVPVLDGNGKRRSRDVTETLNGTDTIYIVYPYRPRIEGLFARIEKWLNTGTRIAHWRVTTKDNITSIYGKSENSRIYDPQQPLHIFEWLIEETRDKKGNRIVYEYKAENTDNLPAGLAEQQRINHNTGFANKYLKRVSYSPYNGNSNRFHFQLLFDYGEHTANTPIETQPWTARLDPFSSYKSGFEIRSYRLCRRVLMLHNFSNTAADDWQLVKSLQLAYQESNALTFLTGATISGYQQTANGLDVRSMPAMEFNYTVPQPDKIIRQVDKTSLENLPAGLDETGYQWIDLAGEGSPGIVSRHDGVIYYKENLGNGEFGSMQPVYTPVALAEDQPLQITDLDGDGVNELVIRNETMTGFYRYASDNWQPFIEFEHNPIINWRDPNLKMLDLSGDGHADILITENELFRWYPSEGAEGYGKSRTVPTAGDELNGPKVLFADPEQSIYLADMSGDGQTDIVRIRNGEVCYWPNLGFGHFGAKVFMADSPKFVEDKKDFNPNYIKLGDIDGSGTTDIMYLCDGKPKYYANQAGNGWSDANVVSAFMPVDALSTVAMVDLLGQGTMCLVWSTSIPGKQSQQMSYVDLMGTKPHLLSEVTDNMGSVTRLNYVPSTQFYLEDKKNGKPWITRLSFPIHCLERVETRDEISGNRFVTRYKYHHGYFDGVEREFRGFGMVEQQDTEEFAALNEGELPEASNFDRSTDVPPVLTKTWFHTGIHLGRSHVSDFFAGLLNEHDTGEYYREPGLTDRQARERLLPDTIMPQGMTPEEEREASRSLKGQMLRQEVYALDGSDKQDIPYTVAEQNFTIQQLQREAENRYGVFFTHPREAITYHYERNPVDPRVQHAMTLDVDEYGNVLKSLAIGYGRRSSDLPDGRDRLKQTTTLLTYTENNFTNAIDNPLLYPTHYRTPLPAETRSYELTGYTPGDNPLRFSFDEWTQNDFDWLTSATEIPYEQTANNASRQKRLIEHMRSLYRRDDLTAFLPLGQVQPLALSGESYKLAFTPGLIASVYQRQLPGQPLENLLPNPAAILEGKGADQGGYVVMDGNWWIPSGRSFFDPNADIINPAATAAQERSTAQAHFYLPRKSTDPFGQSSILDYDAYDLLVAQTVDALGNMVTAEHDYRVLQPWRVTDPNRNRKEVAFDALGMVTATAVMGKDVENLGDELSGFNANLTLAELQTFIADPQGQAASLLGNATTRIVYELDRFQRTGQAPFAATLAREIHFTDPGGPNSPIQISFSYSDGFGREIQKKIQAEAGNAPQRQAPIPIPGGDIRPGELLRDAQGNPIQAHTPQRWVGTGRTVFNNKGKPVRQYEPFFSATHLYEPERDMTDTGVSPVLFYDPVERVVATLHPNHTYEKVVFDPWQQTTYDVNDTVTAYNEQTGDPRTDPDTSGYVTEYFKSQPDSWQTWYQQRIGNQMGVAERDAAQKAAVHTNTPTVAHFDTLGRSFVTITHNRYTRNGSQTEEHITTRIELDIEGNQRSVLDARDRIAMQNDYTMAGPEDGSTANRIHQLSMEAGERWMLNDVTGNPILSWDSRQFTQRMTYDELRRTTGLYVIENNVERLAERTIYGEAYGDAANHRTQVYQIFDGAGIATNVAYDFKGNLLTGRRDLLPEYRQAVDWLQNPAANDGSYTTLTSYDALNRPVSSTSPDGSIYRATFNEANLLDRVDVNLRGAAAATAFVTNIDYDAKGQRQRIVYGNGAQSSYQYDPLTFRLVNMRTTRPATPDATASQLFLNTSVVQDLNYTSDPVGNITRIEDVALRTVFNNNQQVDPVNDHTYDATYRLIETRGREHISQTAFDFNPLDGNFRDHPHIGNRANPNDLQALRNYLQQFEYDATGNFQTMRHVAAGGNWTRTYAYQEVSLIEPGNVSNRLTRTVLGNGPNRIENYTHDIHGNITSMPHLPGMVWDFEDQLQQVNLNTGETAYYVYDSGGERVRKVTDTAAGIRLKERIYLGGFEIYREYGGGGAITLERETLHVTDDQQRIAMVETRIQGTEPGIPAQLIRYQISNHLGSAGVELDGAGALIAYEEYHPYGTTAFQAGRSAAEVNLKRYRYTGKERDEETGFSYHGARYYASWLGRWTSCDPVNSNLMGFERALFQSYEYVENKPVVANDPDGKFFNLVAAAVGGAVGAVVGGAIEAGRQYVTTGEVSDWGAVGASAAGGAVSGAVAGLTMGASLVAQAAVATASGVAGGATTRALTGQEQTAGDVLQDAAIGLVTFGIVKGGSATISALRSSGKSAVTSGTRSATSSGTRSTSSAVSKETVQKSAKETQKVAVKVVEEKVANSKLLYRGMKETGEGLPELGPTARTLGVRPDVDIPVVNGKVSPGTGGMSVAPNKPTNLPTHRRPPELGGTGKDPVWGISELELGPKLKFVQDKATHGIIEPAEEMAIEAFQDALAGIQFLWRKL